MAIVAYAVIKYRLMDIRVAVTSAGIFLVIYALALGVPFYLFFQGHHLAALLLSIVLATIAPFVYSRLRSQAEDKILFEEKVYQDILLRAARGLSRHKTVEDVARFIIQLMFKIVGATSAAFYLRAGDAFAVCDSVGSEGAYEKSFSCGSPLVGYLKTMGAFSLDEAQEAHPGGMVSDELSRKFKIRPAVVAFPVMRDAHVVGILLLGEKKNRFAYSSRDMAVINIIADQMALALENCRYLQRETERMKEDGARARREYLDTMVACMAHEIDNPMTVIMGQAGLLQEVLSASASRIPETIYREIDCSLGHMQSASVRVSTIIKKIEEFAKGGSGKSEPTNIYDVLEGYRVIKGLSKKKKTDILYEEVIAPDLPLVRAEKIMLEEILINFMENAYHAVARREGAKHVILRISKLDDGFVRILFEDNGYGMNAETLGKVFEVPTTTKGSAEGTGLGLYRVRQICDVLGARFGAHSQGPDQGARVWVDLRIL